MQTAEDGWIQRFSGGPSCGCNQTDSLTHAVGVCLPVLRFCRGVLELGAGVVGFIMCYLFYQGSGDVSAHGSYGHIDQAYCYQAADTPGTSAQYNSN